MNKLENNLKKRSLGCVLYELIFLKLAFIKGQEGNPNLPDLSGSRGFVGVLQKYLFIWSFISIKII